MSRLSANGELEPAGPNAQLLFQTKSFVETFVNVNVNVNVNRLMFDVSYLWRTRSRRLLCAVGLPALDGGGEGVDR